MADVLAPVHVVSVGRASVAALAWASLGVAHVTAIVKATFSFATGGAMARIEARELHRAEVHHDKNPMRSLRAASDMAPRRDRVDVLFSGSAHAPNGAAAVMVPVRLAIFDGDRAALDKSLVAHDVSGFQRMPIVYERAFGGMQHPDNPVGSAAPTLLDPTDPKRTAGLGPIARSWLSRRRLLGDTPRSRVEGASIDVPAGFDWAYFQVAPRDQQMDALRGDEQIVLEGLNPTSPVVKMRLPSARAFARVYGLSAHGLAEGRPIPLVADTLHIDGDEQTISIVWRRAFPLPSGADRGAIRVEAGAASSGEPIPWSEPVPSDTAPPGGAPLFAGDMLVGDQGVEVNGGTMMLPQGAALGVASPATVLLSNIDVHPSFAEPAGTLVPASPLPGAPALPFRQGPSGLPSSPSSPPPQRISTGTLVAEGTAEGEGPSRQMPPRIVVSPEAEPVKAEAAKEEPPPAPPPPKRAEVWAPSQDKAPRVKAPAKAPIQLVRRHRLDLIKILYGGR